MRLLPRRAALGLSILLASAGAFADPVTVFAQDPGTGDLLNPIPNPSNSFNAQAAFLTQLDPATVATEGFESFAKGAQAPLSLFNNTATLTQPTAKSSDRIDNVVCDNGNCPGRFNTTAGGANWWQSANTFTISFTNAFSAFGFFGTDMGDFDGSMTVDLLDADGNQIGSSLSISPSTGLGNGSLLFWGFTDAATSYFGIRFNITQLDATDIVGFDDLIIGALPTGSGGGGGDGTVPEPASLALVGLSLFALAAVRRKTKT